jgi:hypothetical protein
MPSKGKYNIKSFKLINLQIQRSEGFIIFVGSAGQISNLLIQDLGILKEFVNLNGGIDEIKMTDQFG